jgi:hypothetical protein
MNKISEYMTNEILLEREEDIIHLQIENRNLNIKIAELRLALLKIQACDFDNLHADLLKKVLQDG